MYSLFARRWFSMPSPSLSCFFVETRRMETAAWGMVREGLCRRADGGAHIFPAFWHASRVRGWATCLSVSPVLVNEGSGERIEGLPDLRHLLVGELRQRQDATALLDAQHGEEVE